MHSKSICKKKNESCKAREFVILNDVYMYFQKPCICSYDYRRLLNEPVHIIEEGMVLEVIAWR